MPPDFERNVYSIEQPIDFSEIKTHPQEKTYTVEEAIDLIGIGKAQFLVFLTTTLCIMATMMEAVGISYMVPAAKCDLELDTMKIGILTGIIFLGIMCTQHLWGFLADLLGRRTVILYSLSLSLMCSLPVAFMQNFWAIVGLRLLSGMSIAGSSAILYTYLGEFYPAPARSRTIIFVAAVSGLTSMLLPIIGWILIRQDFSVRISDTFTMMPWRFQIIIQLIPGTLGVFLVKYLPETPKFLAAIHRKQEVLRTLEWMYHENTGRSITEFPVKQITLPEIDVNEKQYNKKSMKGFCNSFAHETKLLFKREYIGLLLKCCYIQFCIYLISIGLGLWYPELANRISEPQHSDVTICQIIQSKTQESYSNLSRAFDASVSCPPVVNDQMYIANIILGFCYFVGFIIFGYTTNKVHKNVLTTGCLFLSGLSGIILYWASDITAIMILFLSLIMFSGFAISLVSASVFELFPTHLRGMATSLVVLMARTATFTGANTIGYLLDFDCHMTFFGLSALILVAGIIAWILPRTAHH